MGFLFFDKVVETTSNTISTINLDATLHSLADVMPTCIAIAIVITVIKRILIIFLHTVPVADVEEKQAQKFIEKKEEKLEKYTKQFNYDDKIKCEYCDTWQHLNDSGRCSNCNAELEIRKE